MNAIAMPAKAESDHPQTRNEQFKDSFGSWLWGSMIAATVLHFMLFQFWPTLTVEDFSYTVEDLTIVELPPEVEVPPPPKAIARPATPVMATTAIDQDVTIALTTFADNPVVALPPPPTAEEVPDVSAAPVFTPMTVRPEIANLSDIQRALIRLYPPQLRDAGVGGTVVVWFFISDEGRVLSSRVQKGSGFVQLDDAALEVADIFQFTPALNRDKTVAVWIQLPIQFEVQ
jgi:TonB family protein